MINKNSKFEIRNSKLGFTLMELIIAMAILAIVTGSLLGNYTSSQKKGRDSQRKSDLKQLQNALEAYANDNNGFYPNATSGQISGANWGNTFVDPDNPTTIYMKQMVEDPVTGKNYYYVVGTDNLSYQLYACLENTKDKSYNVYADTNCNQCAGVDSNDCTYGVSSSNATP